MTTLFDPVRFGDIQLANRVVMAPLTRNRATQQTPQALHVEYYRQRAGAGLIITEATQIRPDGQGYFDTPGIHSPEQVAAWKQVTDAVHAAGGRIVVQLWHVGRISLKSLQPGGQQPVSSTHRAAKTRTYAAYGELVPTDAPRALETHELPQLIADYVQAAKNAMAAGFDGVEVHAANGYLLDQFLRDSANDRSDEYGGSIENRARLLIEVMTAVAGAIGAGRTALRLSPVTPSNDIGQDSNPQALFNYVAEQLSPLKLAFLEVVEGATGGPRDNAPFDYAALRRRFSGSYIANNGYDRALALDAVASGRADAVAIGRPFIANPDLVERIRHDLPWAAPQKESFYGGGAEGYTDYPAAELKRA
ncbi:alkene reductase [Roseateles saccharophilus]|uniref:N-ethylmaleimide reductase n=1 Tax=Roseateles saccharophilus TaxID=304 RepID=A0A4R3V0J7_ROSSA|nr:alkene reductase [Roseateles saccharophilus]MDG0832308.1 alkene reductase [Roseateles saccharophilus]TCU97002.1 N-ethylmaleimide reductase [Roseateles saccharophilus]